MTHVDTIYNGVKAKTDKTASMYKGEQWFPFHQVAPCAIIPKGLSMNIPSLVNEEFIHHTTLMKQPGLSSLSDPIFGPHKILG
jgi:hypothetical protein